MNSFRTAHGRPEGIETVSECTGGTLEVRGHTEPSPDFACTVRVHEEGVQAMHLVLLMEAPVVVASF